MRKHSNGVIKVVSEELKRHIINEIESGDISQSEAERLYGIPRSSISKMLRLYGRIPPRRQIVEVVVKDQKEKMAELQQALSDAHLKLRLYEKMFELAETEYKKDIKKNFSTKASELLASKAKKSRDCAD